MESSGCLPLTSTPTIPRHRPNWSKSSRLATVSRPTGTPGGRGRSKMRSTTASEPIRPRLFRELLALELELSRRAGRAVELDAYLARFPDQADAVREVFIGCTLPALDPEATWPRPCEATSALPHEATNCSASSERGARQRPTWRATAPCSDWSCSSVITGSPHPAGARRCSTRAAPWRGSAARSSRRATGWRAGVTRSTWSSNTSPAGRSTS